MRAFNLTAPTLDASYENAIQAGSLSHTGNSFRPIGSPAKYVPNPAQYLQGPYPAPVANPVRITRGLNGSTITSLSTPHGIVARPVAHTPSIRGILGQ